MKRKYQPEAINFVKRAKYQMSSEKQASINDMPNELLLEIFSNLRRRDLLSATLVKSNWNNLISNTQKLMKRINKIFINDDNLIKGFPELSRFYETIHIDEISEWNPEIFKCLMNIGMSVNRLVLFECVFFDDDFKSLLECFPNLKELEVYDCHPGISPLNKFSAGDKVNLNKLTHFTLRGYSWPLKLINTPNLKTFEAESLDLYDQEWLIDFLNEQEHLEALNLINIIDLFDSRFGIFDPKFSLKELVLYDLPHTDYAQFFRMLNRSKDSLVTLNIGLETKREITEYALLHLKHLTSLSIDCDSLPISTRFYNHLNTNLNLKEVSIYGCVRQSKTLLQFLRNYPGIEVLKMKALSNLHSKKFTFWHEFSRATPNVNCLSIGILDPYNMVYMKSSKMKHLDVDFIGQTNEVTWIDFCKNNPNLEIFHVFKKQKYFNDEVEVILLNKLPKLKIRYTEY